MRLKRLTLHGFKTFADRTEIEFAPGVTCIVGPNGSGKSNLLDALVWCLGEQKASSVRATKAADVVFAGSGRRKPMGMAEVSLTVDNEDRFLPLDYSEVTVTRRVYRSGDAEYLLNKTPCRLKDITDLFLDTGVGRGAYAIVNQSEIDSILSARAEDRRELFEEAAGIKKYRVKKREAQRKLENVETNLVRVRDIAAELGAQVEPLAKQADVARRFSELSERLRSVEVGQLAADYKRLRDELEQLEATAGAAAKDTARLRSEGDELDAASLGLTQRTAAIEARLDDARLAQQTALSLAERLESRIALAAERRSAAQRTLESLADDLRALDTEQERLSAEAIALAADADSADTALAERSGALADAETVAREAQRALTELAATVAGQEADFLALARRLAAQKAELDAIRERIERRALDLADATARARALESESAGAVETANAASHAVEAARSEHADTLRRIADELVPARAAIVVRLDEITARRQLLDRQLAGDESRLRALEETEAAQEGYFTGVRSVLRAVSEGKLTGRFQLVADAIRAPAELELAIETALGASLQDVIVDSENVAKAAIRYLNDTRGGRATFLPLDALRQVDVPGSLRLASRRHSGVRGSAADLVTFDVSVTAAVHVLLARILVVDDLEIATAIRRQVDDWARLVTLNGELIVPTGAITGGKAGRAPGPNLLSRKREIAELSERVDRGRSEQDRLAATLRSVNAELDTAKEALQAAEQHAERRRDAVAAAERLATAASAEVARLTRESEAQSARVDALSRVGVEDTAREGALSAAIAGSEASEGTVVSAREEIGRRQSALVARRDDARETARGLSAEVAGLRERASGLRRDAARAQDGVRRAQLSTDERARRARDAEAIVQAENADAAGREAERMEASESVAAAGVRLDEFRAQRAELVLESGRLTERARELGRQIAEASERGQAARLRAARLETQAEVISQRLMDEYELHADSAVALTGGVPLDKDTAQEINRLRREIRGLGAVNVGAIDEYERVSERWRFLTEQKSDLEEARGRLLSAIAEIDDSTRGVFTDTFRAVGAAFARYFERLFGGGTTELVMTDPDDVLETGIEILAQPPGKKRQSLALLSGGERALTATALLFAFLEVRPAPFCVLDEVDAPLDGANVEKFADLVREFGRESQFILITHNATTMEAAPLWYGVTMQEPGVSRTLSMRVPEPATAPGEGATDSAALIGSDA